MLIALSFFPSGPPFTTLSTRTTSPGGGQIVSPPTVLPLHGSCPRSRHEQPSCSSGRVGAAICVGGTRVERVLLKTAGTGGWPMDRQQRCKRQFDVIHPDNPAVLNAIPRHTREPLSGLVISCVVTLDLGSRSGGKSRSSNPSCSSIPVGLPLTHLQDGKHHHRRRSGFGQHNRRGFSERLRTTA